MAQHWAWRGAHLSDNNGVKIECKKSVENLRQMASVSTIFDEDCSLKKHFAFLRNTRASKGREITVKLLFWEDSRFKVQIE